MSFLTKGAFIVCALSIPGFANATTPCKSGLSGISILEGPSSYGDQPPDSQSLKPGGKWPGNLIEQGWHNLRKAPRPLSLVCKYANGSTETIHLPDTTDSCVLTPGLMVTCQ